jgi:hypothetical protein
METTMDSDLLEWRNHDTASEITHTGFGPYMVERLADDRFRAWLPDDNLTARLMVDGFTSDTEARAFCQRDVDGRRTLKFIAEAEAAFDAAPDTDDAAEIDGGLQRALLNAAAPDLLEAVNSLLVLHEAHHNSIEHAAARKAIAKAEGRS